MEELAGRALIAQRLGDELERAWDRETRLAQLQLDKHQPVINLRH